MRDVRAVAGHSGQSQGMEDQVAGLGSTKTRAQARRAQRKAAYRRLQQGDAADAMVSRAFIFNNYGLANVALPGEVDRPWGWSVGSWLVGC